ncbi:MAG: hypothetical protein CMJ44_02880 [Pimelobacter sp.]|nr:hypothetical protein [Pimelobacter sp.]
MDMAKADVLPWFLEMLVVLGQAVVFAMVMMFSIEATSFGAWGAGLVRALVRGWLSDVEHATRPVV